MWHSIYRIDHPKLIVLNQKKESIILAIYSTLCIQLQIHGSLFSPRFIVKDVLQSFCFFAHGSAQYLLFMAHGK